VAATVSAPFKGAYVTSELTGGARVGPYEVLATLGAGGMGTVFRARDPRLGRDVAIKVLASQLAADPTLLKRFEQEARVLAGLSHPNVVAVFDVGSADGRQYLVTELLVGMTLHDFLQSAPRAGGELVDAAWQLAEGLVAIHERGVIHRDLKPANIFIVQGGQVKLIDFGLARTEGRGDLTKTGSFMGTPGYMAPEQLHGAVVDARADQFAFGAVLFEMLTHRRAFPGESPMDRAMATLTQTPPELPALCSGDNGPAFQVAQRCLEKDAGARFGSMREVAAAMNALRSSGRIAPLASLTAHGAAVGDTFLPGPVTGIPTAAPAPSKAKWALAAVVATSVVGLAAWRAVLTPKPRPDEAAAAVKIASSVEAMMLTPAQRWALEIPVVVEDLPRTGAEAGASLGLVMVVAQEGFVLGADANYFAAANGAILKRIPNEADGTRDFQALARALDEAKKAFPLETRLVVACQNGVSRGDCDRARISAAEQGGRTLFGDQWLVEGAFPPGVLGTTGSGFEVRFTQSAAMPVRRLDAQSLARLKAKYGIE